MEIVKTISNKYFNRCLRLYCKAMLGYSSKCGMSIYVIGARALRVDGLLRPEDMTPEQWCWKNCQYVLSKAKIEPSKKERQKNRAAAEKRHTVGKKPKKTVNKFVTTDDFLTTYEWRKLRMEALKKYGPKCMCCGATPATGAVMNVDHIKPRKLFPELALELTNLQILCHECNHGKGNWDQSDWRNQ